MPHPNSQRTVNPGKVMSSQAAQRAHIVPGELEPGGKTRSSITGRHRGFSLGQDMEGKMSNSHRKMYIGRFRHGNLNLLFRPNQAIYTGEKKSACPLPADVKISKTSAITTPASCPLPPSRNVMTLNRLPASIVNVRLQPPADETGHAVAQPKVPQHRVVPLLVQEQLPSVAEHHVRLAVPVRVRGVGE